MTSTPDRIRWTTTALWLAHALVRAVLFGYLLVYAWAKLLLLQMAPVDYADALTTVGEKSPMGLLWTFIGFSPLLQFLCGLAELVAALLLVARRTAWLGGLLAAADMAVVSLLNVIYDVSVTQLAVVLLVCGLLVAVPDLPRTMRFLAGRPVGGPRLPRPVPWPRVHAVTRWVVAVAAVLAAVSPLAVALGRTPGTSTSALPGVYRVAADTAAPDGSGWRQVGFGQYDYDRGARIAIRYADGGLQQGWYRHTGPGRVEAELFAPGADSTGLRATETTVVLGWTVRPDGQVTISAPGRDVTAVPDPERRYLFDTRFSWDGSAGNR